MNTFTLRAARPDDVPALVGLIGELAAFENLTHLMQVSPDALAHHLFGPRPVAEAWVAQVGEGNTVKVVALALCFTNFSTFLGQPGLYLEDLYVQPEHRNAGIGRALLRHLAGVAVERNYGRFEWCVLDWNVHAQRFYERMGATLMNEWRLCRVTGDALRRLGSGAHA